MENIDHEKLMEFEKKIKEIINMMDSSLNYEMVTDIDEGRLNINLKGENLGRLIGYHGKILYSLDILFNTLFHRIVNTEDLEFSLDINQYKKERENSLTSMAQRIADEALRKNTAVYLPPMRASERKLIHQVISQIEGVVSESIGEGYERKVVVKPEPLI